MSSSRAKDGTPAVLERLLTLAIPLLQKAQAPPATHNRHPGRVPTYADWQIAVMILPGLLKKRKSKSGIYRQVIANRDLLLKRLNLERLPARSTFMERYARVWPLAQQAIVLQGRVAVREKVAQPQQVAVDKSIVRAKGPAWHQRFRRDGIEPKLRGLDLTAGWGRSATRGWVWGYSYEVAVCAGKNAVVFPLAASADTAEACEMTTCKSKIAQLPAATRTLCVDAGYDSNDLAELFEDTRRPRRQRRRRQLRRRQRRRRQRRRHFLCPPHRRARKNCRLSGRREQQRQRRVKRIAYFDGKQGQRLYRRRKETVEPFNANYKGLFELEDHVWHRGLNNNRTQFLLTIFIYQLLLRYHRKTGHRDAQVQYILDSL
jgi:hypothetical protein